MDRPTSPASSSSPSLESIYASLLDSLIFDSALTFLASPPTLDNHLAISSAPPPDSIDAVLSRISRRSEEAAGKGVVGPLPPNTSASTSACKRKHEEVAEAVDFTLDIWRRNPPRDAANITITALATTGTQTTESPIAQKGGSVYPGAAGIVTKPSLTCPNCGKRTGCSKLAQHLEKCMFAGGRDAGRGSSRGNNK